MPSSTYYAVLLALVLGVGCGGGSFEDKVAGTYEDPDNRKGNKLNYMVLLKEGHPAGAPNAVEFWKSGKKQEEEGVWSVENGEIHLVIPKEGTGILLLNDDGNLELIAVVKEGEREDKKGKPLVFKKIK